MALFSSILIGQEEVPWTPEFRLEWRDFKGEIPLAANAAATTASGISYNFSTRFVNGQMVVDYKVQSFFYPTKSWYRPKLCNDITLNHEQLHFDITELFARKMNKEMSQKKFTSNIKQEVRSIYKRVLKELDDYQKEYDIQTDFSRNLEKQEIWQFKISTLLNENK